MMRQQNFKRNYQEIVRNQFSSDLEFICHVSLNQILHMNRMIDLQHIFIFSRMAQLMPISIFWVNIVTS